MSKESAVARAGHAWTDERADEMRRLPEDARRRLIDEAPTVIGFDRFTQRAQQVALRDGYRKPQQPGPGGQA